MMWQDRQAKFLKKEIEELLSPLIGVAGLFNLLKESLTVNGRGLAAYSVKDRPWPLLPLIVCEVLSGKFKPALPAAAALQFLMAAGDVFDDVEDADSFESLSAKYGTAVAINVATALLILAEKSITSLKEKNVDDNIIVRVMDTVNTSFTTACAGQHLDLSCTSTMNISEETYLRIISMKSASQIECACRTGALLGTKNQEMIDTFATFGYNLGMAAQITNDVEGIIRGNDILKKKMTLPVVYAITQTDGDVHKRLKLAYSKGLSPASSVVYP
jgi:geranylgeranyl pyrophosphate synthase